MNEDIEDPFNLGSLIERLGIKHKENKRKKTGGSIFSLQSEGPVRKRKKTVDYNSNERENAEISRDDVVSSTSEFMEGSNMERQESEDEHAVDKGNSDGSTSPKMVRTESYSMSEVEETIQVAEHLGINLYDFQDQVLNLVNGDGKFCHKQ